MFKIFSQIREFKKTTFLMRVQSELLLWLDIIRILHPDRQQLLILKFVEHLSNAEIGQIMGRTEGAVKSLYHRTLLELREKYNIKLIKK